MVRADRVALPKNVADETGHKYGCLTVMGYAGREPAPIAGRGGHALWICRCNCGEPGCKTEVTVRGARLRAGRIVSCGALRGNWSIRHDARMKVPERKRRAIARRGGDAFAATRRPSHGQG